MEVTTRLMYLTGSRSGYIHEQVGLRTLDLGAVPTQSPCPTPTKPRRCSAGSGPATASVRRPWPRLLDIIYQNAFNLTRFSDRELEFQVARLSSQPLPSDERRAHTSCSGPARPGPLSPRVSLPADHLIGGKRDGGRRFAWDLTSRISTTMIRSRTPCWKPASPQVYYGSDCPIREV